VKAIHG